MHIISYLRIAVNGASEKFWEVVVAGAGDVFVQITSKPHVLLLSLDEEKIIFSVTGGNAGSMMFMHGVKGIKTKGSTYVPMEILLFAPFVIFGLGE